MNLLRKIQKAYTELKNEKGDFLLFACVELVDNENEWDIVVCANWLPERKRDAIDIIVSQLDQILEEDDFLSISRVIILNKNDPFYHELKEISKDIKENVHNDFTIAGLDIKEIHILQIIVNENIKEHSFLNGFDISKYIEMLVKEELDKVEHSSKKSADIKYSESNQYKTQSNNIIDFQEQKNKPMAA